MATNGSARSQTRRRLTELTFLGVNPDADKMPLSECQGDCDVDTDCLDGLVCMQRKPNMPVPGCDGNDESTVSYCAQAQYFVDDKAGNTEDASNGAVVLSVSVTDINNNLVSTTSPVETPETGTTTSEVQSDNSSARIASTVLTAALATSAVFFGIL